MNSATDQRGKQRNNSGVVDDLISSVTSVDVLARRLYRGVQQVMDALSFAQII